MPNLKKRSNKYVGVDNRDMKLFKMSDEEIRDALRLKQRIYDKTWYAKHGKKYYKKNRRRKLANNTRWNNKNKDHVKAVAHARYLAKRDEILAKNRVWREKNKARMKKIRREYYLANLLKLRTYSREYSREYKRRKSHGK